MWHRVYHGLDWHSHSSGKMNAHTSYRKLKLGVGQDAGEIKIVVVAKRKETKVKQIFSSLENMGSITFHE